MKCYACGKLVSRSAQRFIQCIKLLRDTSLAIALLLMVAHLMPLARCATNVVKLDISREIVLHQR